MNSSEGIEFASSQPCMFCSIISCFALESGVEGFFMQKRINLTKTIRKLPIKDNLERAGYYVHDDLANQEVKYDTHEEWFKVSFQ